ncbi:hypothetical protein GW17_00058497 [Ensete ventricosum]|nr:hypothetical protein GW17_00058497 [Ensete ventricosum]RZS28061.1 hypothetical protein BHM03_00061609 [Ensete ventricosum]
MEIYKHLTAVEGLLEAKLVRKRLDDWGRSGGEGLDGMVGLLLTSHDDITSLQLPASKGTTPSLLAARGRPQKVGGCKGSRSP